MFDPEYVETQTPCVACVTCMTCLIDGPIPDLEFVGAAAAALW
jgi:hypothetical protein